VERQLRADIFRQCGARTPTLADLGKLPFLEQVVKESMRLYPPVWIVGRAAEEADTIGGARIPKGGWVFLSPYVTHRLPAYWDNPEGFDPSRFSPEQTERRPRLAYLPFAGGPRQCIGDAFAMMEAQLVVATVLRRVQLALAPWQRVEAAPLFTLRPRHGLAMFPTAPARGALSESAS
jgi:cytochrome P450